MNTPQRCVVLLPQCVPKGVDVGFLTQLGIEFRRKLDAFPKIEEVIAIGPRESHHWWPGPCLDIEEALSPLQAETQAAGGSRPTLVAGLDAPAIRHETLIRFSDGYQALSDPQRQLPYCTFRKTPDHQSLGLMQNGGNIFLSVNYQAGRILVSRILSNLGNDNVTVTFGSKSSPSIRISGCGAKLVLVRSLEGHLLESWSLPSADRSPSGDYATVTGRPSDFTIELRSDCVLTIHEPLEGEGLYSSCDFRSMPIAVPGLIDVDPQGRRFLHRSGRAVHGRQAFPDTYEPFLGLVIVPGKIPNELLVQGEAWLGKNSMMQSFLVNDQEARLLSERPLYLKRVFHKSTPAHRAVPESTALEG